MRCLTVVINYGLTFSKLSLFRSALWQCEIHILAKFNNPQQVLSQAAQAHNTRSYIVFFFTLLCERSAKRDMGHILYYLTIELDHAKRDSRLAAYVKLTTMYLHHEIEELKLSTTT